MTTRTETSVFISASKERMAGGFPGKGRRQAQPGGRGEGYLRSRAGDDEAALLLQEGGRGCCHLRNKRGIGDGRRKQGRLDSALTTHKL